VRRDEFQARLDEAVLRGYSAASGASVKTPDTTDAKLAALSLPAAAGSVPQDAPRTAQTSNRAKPKRASAEGKAAVETLARTRSEVEAHEKDLRKAAGGVLLQVRQQVARNFEENAVVHDQTVIADGRTSPEWEPPSIDELIALDALEKMFRAGLDPVRRKTLRALAEDTLAEVGIVFNVSNPYFASTLDDTGRAIKHISETERNVIQLVMAEANDKGLSVTQAADLIRSRLSDGTPARVRAIAATEIARLANGGRWRR
jgi:hypothetical protein